VGGPRKTPAGVPREAPAAASAARLLRPGGYFVMEHAEVQAAWISAMLARSRNWSSITTHLDLNGKERATSALLAEPDNGNGRIGE
jgi:release factor glutamine methyltransferase